MSTQDDHKPHPQGRLKFDGRITLGNIIQIILVLAAITGFAVRLEKNININSYRLGQLEKREDTLEKTLIQNLTTRSP